MVKLILNKKYKTNNPGDIVEANKRLEELLINKGMAHYAQMGGVIKPESIPKPHNDGFILPPQIVKNSKVKKPRKPRKKKAKKFEW